MSRQIDLMQPLSDEDRAYLIARARYTDIAQADAVAAGTEYSDSMLTAGDVLKPDSFVMPPNTGDVNPTPVEEREGPTVVGPHADGTLGMNGVEPTDVPSEDDSEVDADVSYDTYTVAVLKGEVERRNAERAENGLDPLDVPSKKAELIAVLEADDADGDDEDESDESQD